MSFVFGCRSIILLSFSHFVSFTFYCRFQFFDFMSLSFIILSISCFPFLSILFRCYRFHFAAFSLQTGAQKKSLQSKTNQKPKTSFLLTLLCIIQRPKLGLQYLVYPKFSWKCLFIFLKNLNPIQMAMCNTMNSRRKFSYN